MSILFRHVDFAPRLIAEALINSIWQRALLAFLMCSDLRRMMMSNYKSSKLKQGRFALTLGAMLCLFTPAVGLQARSRPLSPEESHEFNFTVQGQGRRTITEVNENDSNNSTHIKYSDGDHTLEIKAKESMEFTDDDADIKSISRDGYLMVEEERGGTTRKWEVRQGADGRPQSSFYLRGQAHPLDREARQWLAEVLPDVIRNTAIGARARVLRIQKQRGAGGVLDEISLIKSEGAKRIYFRELFNSGNSLDAATLRRATRQVAREIHSDGEKANLFIGSADVFLVHQSIAPDFFEAIGSIHSDGERRRVLSAILNKNLNDENIIRTLKSARAMSSDGEKANLLIQHTEVFLNHPSSLQAFFETTDSLHSDGEHARVLSALLKRQGLSRENLSRALRSAERISSDGEKANVLIHAARVYASDEAALSAIADAAKTIKSDGEKSRVLSAIKRHGQ
jgi:hypothetical protein